MDVLNLSAYRFVSIEDVDSLRARLRDCASENGLRGTILIAQEGLNFSIAGSAAGVRAFWSALTADRRFADMESKEGWSAECPFNHLVVKIKPEIVTMGRPDIAPQHGSASRVSALDLKTWLDQGRDITLLDARNTFEFELGTFDGALHLGNHSFRGFPEVAQAQLDRLSNKTVVTFCTGGIRCEKAALFLDQLGCRVLQLDGGILGYFSAVGGEHFSGECFVFDQRIALRG